MEKIKEFFKRLNLGARINKLHLYAEDMFDKALSRYDAFKKEFNDKLLAVDRIFDEIEDNFKTEVDKVVDRVEAIQKTFLSERKELKAQIKTLQGALDQMRDIVACNAVKPNFEVGDVVGDKTVTERIPTFIQIKGGYMIKHQYRLKGEEGRFTENDLSGLKNK